MSEGGTPNIDFITDVDLRRSLESDITELEFCRKSRAWKSVMVLVGSITEALLIDSVAALGIESKEKALKLSLSEAIDKCLAASVLSQKTADLSSVIKEYRNLIHPGRLLRLKEKVDAESASVANSLLRIVIREIGEKRTQNYGYTAEQLLNKLYSDPSSIAIAPHLLSETPGREIERLLLDVLPTRYKKEIFSDDFPDGNYISALPALYRAAYVKCPEDVKESVGRWFLRQFKENEGPYLSQVVFPLVDAQYLMKLKKDEKNLIINYVVEAAKREGSTFGKQLLFQIVKLAGDADELRLVIDIVIRNYGQNVAECVAALDHCHWNVGSELDEAFKKRLTDWVKLYRNPSTSNQHRLKLANAIDESMRTHDDIPF